MATSRPKPQDHLPKAEARSEDTTIEFDGETYAIPPSSEWDIEVIEAAEEGRIVASTKLLLGPDQWAKFRKDHKTAGELERFFEALGGVMGGNL